MSQDASTHWYALKVGPNREKSVAAGLRGRGYIEFLPTWRQHRRWSDRTKTIDAPLFPGYVFSRFDARLRLPILMTPGVLYAVGFSGAPEPIADSEIEAIRAIVEAEARANPCDFLREGERVVLEGGPLCGIEGIFLREKADCRLVVSVELLRRSIAVEIRREWVRRIARREDLRLQPIEASRRAPDHKPLHSC